MSLVAGVDIKQFQEAPRATWDKRFFATHYSYRDFHTATTGFNPLADAASYIFGTASRAVATRNWPRVGDFTSARTAYARLIRVHCTSDVWVVISALNPRWIHDYIKKVASRIPSESAINQLDKEGIPFTITETPQYILANSIMPFYPSYAYAITFYYDPAAGMAEGTIRIWIAGNATGAD